MAWLLIIYTYTATVGAQIQMRDVATEDECHKLESVIHELDGSHRAVTTRCVKQ